MPGTRWRAPSLWVPLHIFSLPVLTRLKAESNRGRKITASIFLWNRKVSRRDLPAFPTQALLFLHTKNKQSAEHGEKNQPPDLGQSAASPKQRQCQDRFAFGKRLGCSCGGWEGAGSSSRGPRPAEVRQRRGSARWAPRAPSQLPGSTPAAWCTAVTMSALLLLPQGIFWETGAVLLLLRSFQGSGDTSRGWETLLPAPAETGSSQSRQSFTWVPDRGRCSNSGQSRALRARAGTKCTGCLCNTPRKINFAKSCCIT